LKFEVLESIDTKLPPFFPGEIRKKSNFFAQRFKKACKLQWFLNVLLISIRYTFGLKGRLNMKNPKKPYGEIKRKKE